MMKNRITETMRDKLKCAVNQDDIKYIMKMTKRGGLGDTCSYMYR